jgi:competence protein ComEC
MKYPLLCFFLILSAGIAAARTAMMESVDPGVMAGWTATALAAAWIVAGLRKPILAAGACIAAACLGIGLLLGAASPHWILQKTWAREIARVADRTAVIEGVMTEGRRSWRDGYGRERYSFTVETQRGGLRVFGSRSSAALPAYGERVRVTGKINVPGGRSNPAGFDWWNFLRTRGSYAVMRAERFEVIGPPRGWKGAVYTLREKLVRAMDNSLDDQSADISKAIFLGERSELDPDFRRALVNTGTLHLFAISGFNVGFVALVLFGVFTLARVPNPWRSLVVLALLGAYAVLVGDNSPVVRAVIMSFFLIGAELCKTRVSALQGLGAAGTLMLVLNPEEALDPAFQLSFAAVAGLALIVPLWGAIGDVRRARSDRWWARLWAGLTLTALTSLAAWVTTAPILIHHFNRFSTVAPVINILLVPIAFILNLLLMIFSFLAMVLPAAARLTAPLIELNVRGLTWLVDVFDRLPGASWNLAAWHVLSWIAFGVWWVWLAQNRKEVRRSLRVTLSLLAVLGLIGADAARAQAVLPPLRVTHFDVGQASAALVEIGNTRILMDTGKGGDADAAGRVILPYLASIGVSSIDAVILSHPQFDHAGGVLNLLRGAKVGAIYTNGDESESAFFRNILKEARRLKVPVVTVRRGDHITGLPAGARLSVLHPGPAVLGKRDLNERSAVILLEAEGRKLLWTGDIGEEGLTELLTSARLTHLDLLQVPHHGARTGPNAGELLALTRPEWAVISCGVRNRYGHPHSTTLTALQGAAARLHRTDTQGAHQWTIDRTGTSSSSQYGVV